MDLLGWDTTYVLRADRVNDVLAARSEQLIMSFDIQDEELGLETIGQFSSWQIVEGGSGDLLYLKLIIGEGSCTFNFDSSHTVDLKGVSLVVCVQLQLLPTGNSQEQLCFYITQAGEMDQEPEPGMIVPVLLDDPNDQMSLVETTLLTNALTTYIVDNAEQITFVFATINLVPPETDSWLTPVHSAYCYADREGTLGALGIMSVTKDIDISELPRQIDNKLWSTRYEASYGISSKLFVRNVILPLLAQAFGVSIDYFIYQDTNNGQIEAHNLRIFVEAEGSTYRVDISFLTAYIVANELLTRYHSLRTVYEYVLGSQHDLIIDYINTNNDCKYNDELREIEFLEDPEPVIGPHRIIPPNENVFLPIISILLTAISHSIAEEIANKITNGLGGQFSLINLSIPIDWTDTYKFDVQNAVLDTSFYMEGNLVNN